MTDYISRAAAVDALDEIESEIANGYGYQYQKWRKYFCELPSAQPERKKGKWIPVTGIYKVTDEQFPNTHIEWVDATEPDEIDGVRCSECGTVYDFIEARNWCSECGARMER